MIVLVLAGAGVVWRFLPAGSGAPRAGAPDGSSASSAAPVAAGPVTYEVTGSGTAVVTYSAGIGEPADAGPVTLPFTITVAAGAEPSVYTVVARRSGPGGTLSCSVSRADGVLDRRTADGSADTVTCSGS